MRQYYTSSCSCKRFWTSICSLNASVRSIPLLWHQTRYETWSTVRKRQQKKQLKVEAGLIFTKLTQQSIVNYQNHRIFYLRNLFPCLASATQQLRCLSITNQMKHIAILWKDISQIPFSNEFPLSFRQWLWNKIELFKVNLVHWNSHKSLRNALKLNSKVLWSQYGPKAMNHKILWIPHIALHSSYVALIHVNHLTSYDCIPIFPLSQEAFILLKSLNDTLILYRHQGPICG